MARRSPATARKPQDLAVRAAELAPEPRGRVPVLSGRPLALWLLAVSLLKVLVRRLLSREHAGLARFQENYGAERLGAFRPSDRAELPAMTRCIACGRCDIGEGERVAASHGEYPGLMQLVLASSRSMPDFDAAARGFAHVPDAVLHRKVARCPVRIPFPAVARFVREKANG